MEKYIVVFLILVVVLLAVNVICLKYTFDYSKSMQFRHHRKLMRECKRIGDILFEINDSIVRYTACDYIGICKQPVIDENGDGEDKPNLVDLAIVNNNEEEYYV